jgi:hypothetical protein
LAKPFINPIFAGPCALVAFPVFRYLWNNPPTFARENIWVAILTPVTVYLVISFALTCLVSLGWRQLKSN